MLQTVVLAGGLGTRMRPQTEKVPKALLEVARRPFATWQLEQLSSQGVRNVLYCVGYLGEQVSELVGDGSRWGLSVEYSYETGELLGTGGALRLAFERGLLQDTFFVLYGDSYLPTDFHTVETAFRSSEAPALMTVLLNDDRWQPSNAEYADGMVVRYDKRSQHPNHGMRHIDYGLSVLHRSIVEHQIPGGSFSDLSDLFQYLSASGHLAGLEVEERFYEIGSPEGLAALEDYLEASSVDHPQPSS